MEYPAPEKKPGEDQVLDVNLDDAEEAPAEGVLEVTLDDDLPAESAQYPEVTETQQRAAANSVVLQCLCSVTRQGFEVRFEELEPGVYYATEVTPTAKGKPVVESKGGEGLSQITGNFRMGADFACPHCKSTGLSACEVCQTVLCAGGISKDGGCQCPGCGTILTLSGQPATGARGAFSGKKKRL